MSSTSGVLERPTTLAPARVEEGDLSTELVEEETDEALSDEPNDDLLNIYESSVVHQGGVLEEDVASAPLMEADDAADEEYERHDRRPPTAGRATRRSIDLAAMSRACSRMRLG